MVTQNLRSAVAAGRSLRAAAWGPVGYITYKRTYARPLASGGTEEFPDTVERIVSACRDQLHVGFTEEEEEQLRAAMYEMRGLPAGRFLWQLGTETVDRLGLLSLQNCAFTTIDSPIRPFTWAMDCLMLGSGVGYNIQREFVYKLPQPRRVTVTRQDTKDADFIVPDTREGWVELLRKTLEAHFVDTGKDFSYSCMLIRSKDALIKGFGGRASGPDVLCWGIAEISKLLNSRAGKSLRSVDCLDIMNIIGYIVVAGNVRRSAQIAIGDCDDLLFLRAKRWDLGNIPAWRAMSNNSVVCNDLSLLPEEFWEGYKGNGEPYGLINLRMLQTMGRTGQAADDRKVLGVNPCAEQGLEPYETCCLGEIFLPNCNSYTQFVQTARLLYRICKHSLRLPCHHPETEAVVHKNMRMGLGVTGYMQATAEQKSWLARAAVDLQLYDMEYSGARGYPGSIKLLTVKPSGTLSLLAGVTPGAHPGFSQYHIRRIRMDARSELVDVCRQHGFPVEPQKRFDGTDDPNTVVVEFPCAFPEGTVLAADMTAVDQLETIKQLQTEWSDNAVSCTIYYKLEELPAIREWLQENYSTNIKSCSFLLHSGHGFVQAPLEEITHAEYLRRKNSSRDIVAVQIGEQVLLDADCESGSCPIR